MYEILSVFVYLSSQCEGSMDLNENVTEITYMLDQLTGFLHRTTGKIKINSNL